MVDWFGFIFAVVVMVGGFIGFIKAGKFIHSIKSLKLILWKLLVSQRTSEAIAYLQSV